MNETSARRGASPPWLRIWVEAIVIVGSILLAFGIDAAWDNRGEDRRREALYAAIRNDMARAMDEVERVAGHHQGGWSAAAALLDLRDVDPRDPDQSRRVDSLVAAAWGATASYDATLGAVENLFGGGGLDLVTDADLAYELTAFPALVADLGREQVKLQATADELHAYLGNEGVDLSLLDLPWFDVPWETGNAGTQRIVTSSRFRGLVSMLWYKYNNTTGDLNGMRDAIVRIEALLPGA